MKETGSGRHQSEGCVAFDVSKSIHTIHAIRVSGHQGYESPVAGMQTLLVMPDTIQPVVAPRYHTHYGGRTGGTVLGAMVPASTGYSGLRASPVI